MTDGGFGAKVENILLELAAQQATGALTVTGPDTDQSVVWFRDGLVYSVSVPGRRPLLGVRLMSSGSLTPESLAEALEVQRTELQGWRLGELLVHLGFVDRSVVEAFVLEQVRDQVADLLHWQVRAHRFRNGQRTRQDVAPPAEVTALLAEARERDDTWAALTPRIGGPDAVPVLSASDPAAGDVVLGPYDWALLCKVDGLRSIADLADDCGLTVFEAGQVVDGLLTAGLVDVETVTFEPETAPDPAPPLDVATSVARVTAALSDMLGPGSATTSARAATSPFGAPPVFSDPPLAEVVPLRAATPDAEPATSEDGEEVKESKAERRARKQAEEQAREEQREREEAERAEQERLEQEQAEQDAAELERLEAEQLAAQEEAERLEARRKEQQERTAARAEALAERRRAAEAAAARLEEARREQEEEAERKRIEDELRREEEQIAAEEERIRLEAERLEAERIAAEEETARLEAERLEAERLEAERIAAEEEAARLEAERLEAERLEAERIAAEEEAARLEAERIAAEEEAARLEAARLEAARLEAERLEAERLAAEEADRLELERLQAEWLEAERLEAERLAAEEAARVEAERVEAERVEAERIAAEEETARLEAERLEAERLEAERIAAEEEAARLEAERLEAELVAALAGESDVDEDAADDDAETVSEEARLEAVLSEPVPLVAPLDRPGYSALLTQFDQETAAVVFTAEPAHEAEPESDTALDQVSSVDHADEETADESPEGPDDTNEPALVGAPAEQLTDTAALLRELSSLSGFGMDSVPVAGSSGDAPRPVAPRKPPPEPQKKKGRLFRR